VYYDDALAFCQSLGVAFCETSSIEGQNVDMSFAELCRMIEGRIDGGQLALESVCPRRISDEGDDEGGNIKLDQKMNPGNGAGCGC